ncbi:MAG: OmpA family protein [Deltaproteobacteria bacterium]|nr:MAG: OmpA family protein [Deltaproteobacteria bacterium]
MRLAGVIAIAVALGATAFAAWAVEGDLEGAKDHPMVQRFPGSVIGTSVTREFEEFPFPTADEGSDNTTKTVEGRYTRLDYNLPSNASCTQVIRNYEKAFQAAGLTTHRGVNLSDKIFTNPPGGKWVSAEGKPAGRSGQVYLYYACTGEGGDLGRLIVVESQEMEQKVALDASAMQAEIEKSGHVALHGINFDTGKATITPDSAATLQQIAELLSRNTGWKLRIEGHTDDVGHAKDNLVLSRKRAEAVRDWLVAKAKVAAARLETKGLGDTKPVAGNDTDDGRAKNRRVELVKL